VAAALDDSELARSGAGLDQPLDTLRALAGRLLRRRSDVEPAPSQEIHGQAAV